LASGSSGFKGARKVLLLLLKQRQKKQQRLCTGMKNVEILVKGQGSGRAAIRAIEGAGFDNSRYNISSA
jgi:ribosomal protein S11